MKNKSAARIERDSLKLQDRSIHIISGRQRNKADITQDNNNSQEEADHSGQNWKIVLEEKKLVEG